MRKQLPFAAVLTTAAALFIAAPATHASEAEAPAAPKVLAEGLFTPLHIGDGPGGSLLVTEQFAGRLIQIDKNGDRTVLHENPGWSVAGSDLDGDTIYVAESQGAGTFGQVPLVGHILAIEPDGSRRTIGDLAALETTKNPDGGITYGFENLPADCAALLPEHAIAKYQGQIDSHPYGITIRGNTIYVADAGANSVVAVDIRTGNTKTVAVLPPSPFQVTAEAAAASGLPACTVGHTYWFEAVPTDVEFGLDGWLYVTSLPGGPEDPALGARGAVLKVNPHDGQVKVFADKVMSPTGIDKDDKGDFYVASLFGEGVLKFSADSGERRVVLSAMLTADVDMRGGTIYASVNALPADPMAPPAGQVVTLWQGDH